MIKSTEGRERERGRKGDNFCLDRKHNKNLTLIRFMARFNCLLSGLLHEADFPQP